MEQKIVTTEETERLRQYVKTIVGELALGQQAMLDNNLTEDGFFYDFSRLLRKPEGIFLFIKKHPNPETLSLQEKEHWERNRIGNIKSISNLIKELIIEYGQQYGSEPNEKKKSRINWIINALNEEYDLYFRHIIESNVDKFNESKEPLENMTKNTIKKIIKEELTRSDKAEIKKLARAEFEDMLKSSDIKSKIEKMVKDHIGKDKATQKEIANITQKVLVQFYKTLWTRRSFWANKLDNI